MQQIKMQQRMLHEERLQQETQERMLARGGPEGACGQARHADGGAGGDSHREARRAQDAQKAAYEELERALTNPPPPIDQRDVALGGGGMRKR